MERVIPAAWLPQGAAVDRVIVHWSAGGYKPSILDRAHYHAIIDGDGRAIQGKGAAGSVLAHTRGLNTGSYGLSIACMLGATSRHHGPCPMREHQWDAAAQAAAEVCQSYDLPVDQRHVLVHSEVTHVYGILQRGKWDVDQLSFARRLSPNQVHDQLREKVRRTIDFLSARNNRRPAEIAVNGQAVDAEGYLEDGASWGWVRPLLAPVGMNVVNLGDGIAGLRRGPVYAVLSARLEKGRSFIKLAELAKFPGLTVTWDGRVEIRTVR